MKKRKTLKLDRETVRQLTKPELRHGAGNAATQDYGYTCYSCDATWCNQACSMAACS